MEAVSDADQIAIEDLLAKSARAISHPYNCILHPNFTFKTNPSRTTPLHLAATKGNADICKILIDHVVKFTTKMSSGVSLLCTRVHGDTFYGPEETEVYNLKDALGLTPVFRARSSQVIEIFLGPELPNMITTGPKGKTLLKYCVDEAIVNRDIIRVLKEQINQIVPINWFHYDTVTRVHKSVLHGPPVFATTSVDTIQLFNDTSKSLGIDLDTILENGYSLEQHRDALMEGSTNPWIWSPLHKNQEKQCSKEKSKETKSI